MNSTSEDTGDKLSLDPDVMDNRTLGAMLAASASLAFLIVLVVFVALSGNNPGARVRFGLFLCVPPALCAFVLLKATNLVASRWGAVLVYVALFGLTLFIQAYAH